MLVRDTYNGIWKATFFSHIKDDDNSTYKYVCNCISWRQCIPYESNESFYDDKTVETIIKSVIGNSLFKITLNKDIVIHKIDVTNNEE